MRLEEMTDEQLNLLVHKEVMQLSVEPELMEDHYFGDYPDYECAHCGGKMGKVSGPCYAPVDVDSYTTNLNECAKMEKQLYANHNWRASYINELMSDIYEQDEVYQSSTLSRRAVFLILLKSPRQRVLAALKAVGVEQHQPAPDGEG